MKQQPEGEVTFRLLLFYDIVRLATAFWLLSASCAEILLKQEAFKRATSALSYAARTFLSIFIGEICVFNEIILHKALQIWFVLGILQLYKQKKYHSAGFWRLGVDLGMEGMR